MAAAEQGHGDKTQKTVYVVWDFDWSLINENSDYYPFASDKPDEEKIGDKDFGDVYSEHKYKFQPKFDGDRFCFTNFMNDVGWPSLFETGKFTKSQFEELLGNIPVFKENIDIVNTLYKYSNNDKNDYTIKQFVASDANTVLIETILKKHNLLDKVDGIFTNGGKWETININTNNNKKNDDNKENKENKEDKEKDDESRRIEVLRCWRYEKEPPLDCNHYKLRLCPANMCKGKIMDTIFNLDKDKDKDKNKNKGIDISCVIYIGDGGGDYCGCSRLRKDKDYAFVRKGKTLEKVIGYKNGNGQNIKAIEKYKNATKIEANIMYWKDGKELLNCFTHVLKDVFAQHESI